MGRFDVDGRTKGAALTDFSCSSFLRLLFGRRDSSSATSVSSSGSVQAVKVVMKNCLTIEQGGLTSDFSRKIYAAFTGSSDLKLEMSSQGMGQRSNQKRAQGGPTPCQMFQTAATVALRAHQFVWGTSPLQARTIPKGSPLSIGIT